jgi:hypothetical protein
MCPWAGGTRNRCVAPDNEVEQTTQKPRAISIREINDRIRNIASAESDLIMKRETQKKARA